MPQPSLHAPRKVHTVRAIDKKSVDQENSHNETHVSVVRGTAEPSTTLPLTPGQVGGRANGKTLVLRCLMILANRWLEFPYAAPA